MAMRLTQKPLQEKHRSDPGASQITLKARASQAGAPIACAVDIGRATYQAETHRGVGGSGTAACSGKILLGALAACAQMTCQMVATAMGIRTKRIEVVVEGDLQPQGTEDISKEAPISFERVRIQFEVDAPSATAEQLSKLLGKTEQYCLVMQMLPKPPMLQTKWIQSQKRNFNAKLEI